MQLFVRLPGGDITHLDNVPSGGLVTDLRELMETECGSMGTHGLYWGRKRMDYSARLDCYRGMRDGREMRVGMNAGSSLHQRVL